MSPKQLKEQLASETLSFIQRLRALQSNGREIFVEGVKRKGMTQGDSMLIVSKTQKQNGRGDSAFGVWLPRACLTVDPITSAWSSAELVLE